MRAQRIALTLQLREIAPRLLDDRGRNAGQRCHLQPITLIGRSLLDAVQEHQLLTVLHRFNVHIGDARRLFGKAREFEVMRGEQRECLYPRRDEGGAGPGQ